MGKITPTDFVEGVDPEILELLIGEPVVDLLAVDLDEFTPFVVTD